MSKYINYFFFEINKKISIGTRPLSGRNFSGKICVHHKAGGNKNKYIFIDFFRRLNIYGYLYKIFKSFYRTSFIGGIIYENGLFSYIILSENLKLGSRIYSGSISKELNDSNIIGNSLILREMKLFSILNNIEDFPYKGGSLIRAAGTSAILTSKFKDKVVLKLKSGWNLTVSEYCIATIGIISNMKHKFEYLKKAGKSRSLGIRPTVRGVAMNPCDHPHGGGEGRKSPPSAQRSPWGWLTKGTPSLKKIFHKKRKKLYKSINK